ncbi:2,3-bisphosphoglycerate-dependent phosphoglycerate mutase [Sedimentibacter acidaminivorans]|uniref:2,3-bisphosphoglycerate-dependent phosphoglycerate mutase n=1 Tax=Sedimentibacter acidaminivorans TaxID=913099 RepID=A0ABS4GCF0_9FIRM|nr:histidine phosphatase family protein [Sedimentibacter acidaminivorans]MBP1925372.1 2,3-bisphosphoglycerate-dependent phosphoglycerate mutase [Sedimentibacter acidaminivorans]
MTIIYFVRHAEPDYNIHDDLTRPLTSKGKKDVELVNNFLEDKHIDVVLSSPFLRAIETVNKFSEKTNTNIIVIDDFRERKIDNCWIEDFNKFSMKQWNDFDYKLSNGECLREVQQRNINALKKILIEYENQNIVIGSHGTALSTIINYYDKSFCYDNFNEIRTLMPWIVKFTFNSEHCVEIEKINVFTL